MDGPESVMGVVHSSRPVAVSGRPDALYCLLSSGIAGAPEPVEDAVFIGERAGSLCRTMLVLLDRRHRPLAASEITWDYDGRTASPFSFKAYKPTGTVVLEPGEAERLRLSVTHLYVYSALLAAWRGGGDA